MQDTASHGTPQLDIGELRHTLSVHDVERELSNAGVPRSHRQVIRYCETGMLEAVKVPGPTGPQWFVSPASLPKAIGDLRQWEAQRASRTAPRPAASDPVTVLQVNKTNTDTASHGEPQHAASDEQNKDGHAVTEPDTARHSTSDLDIYEHPYVKRLESRIEKWEDKYEQQVRRTEEIQMKSQAQLLELQRMTAVGQSETLANFMLKAKDWMLGRGTDDTAKEESETAQS